MKQPFEKVVAQHSATVLRACRVVLGPHDADDAWSETFLSAMRAYPDLAETANVQAWLVTIAHRKAIDMLRAAKRNPLPVEEVSDAATGHGIPGVGDPDLWVAVSGLPNKQRQAVAYRGGIGLRRNRPNPRRQRRYGATSCRGRRQEPQKKLSGRDHERSTIMTDIRNDDDVAAVLSTPADTDTDADMLDRLHRRLEQAAEREHLVDIAYTTMDTPVGSLLLAATPKGLVRVAYDREDHDAVLQSLADRISPRILHAPTRLDTAGREIEEYFAGRRTNFDLPLDFCLSHGFRQRVQQHLSQIAYGHTECYQDVAVIVGNPKAVRAVGTACATNPLPVVVPCHRVLRSDGTLGGYVGGYVGGPAGKTTLLELERQVA